MRLLPQFTWLSVAMVAGVWINWHPPKPISATRVMQEPAIASRQPASIAETSTDLVDLTRPPQSAAPSRLRELESAVERASISPDERAFLSSPHVNEWEKKLKIAFIARLHSDKIPGGEELGGLYVAAMRSHPEEAMSAIKSMLGKLSVTAYPIDRAALIDVAGDIPGKKAEAKALATQEILANVVTKREVPEDATEEQLDEALTSRDTDLLPMVSHSVLMRTADSPEEALALTLMGMRAQEDPGIRAVLLNQFVQTYPQLENEIRREVARAQITLPAAGES